MDGPTLDSSRRKVPSPRDPLPEALPEPSCEPSNKEKGVSEGSYEGSCVWQIGQIVLFRLYRSQQENRQPDLADFPPLVLYSYGSKKKYPYKNLKEFKKITNIANIAIFDPRVGQII